MPMQAGPKLYLDSAFVELFLIPVGARSLLRDVLLLGRNESSGTAGAPRSSFFPSVHGTFLRIVFPVRRSRLWPWSSFPEEHATEQSSALDLLAEVLDRLSRLSAG